MPIIAKGSSASSFLPCPEGPHQAVCCDVVDKGVLDTPWGQKHKVQLRWQVSESMPDGKPYLVTRQFTLSLHEKAALRGFLESWRGKPFTDQEVEGFDLERLLGANCLLNVVHKQGSKGGTFANVISVMPVSKSMAKMGVTGYTREVERTTNPEPDEVPNDDTDPYGTGEDDTFHAAYDSEVGF